ncbi:MAG TPA: LytTR family DNA-binding domain-containing protein [Fibrobacteria bacterium]|nr:LytTR family DNA-binding domain-containing protein [Fibrobacteria bacterium]
MVYRTLIVEDEKNARDRLRSLLKGWEELIEVIGEAENGPEAIRKIKEMDPDLIFLDIKMPGMDGFDVIQNLEKQPIIIFTTAYDEHALEAFSTNAIGYLLKPVSHEDIGRTFKKLMNLEKQVSEKSHRGDRDKRSDETVLSLVRELLVPQYQNIISCKVGDKLQFIKTPEILYFKSDNRSTFLFTSTGKKFIVDAPLIEMEKRVNPKEFIRIRRGTIVNLAWISEIRRTYNGRLKVILMDKQGTELEVSRGYVDALKAF